jgi:glutamate-1-semialdehyde 2,1-aminomutase
MITTKTSKDIYKELCSVIPGGVNSPVRACKAVDCEPIIIEKAEGALITDIEGNSYIDFIMSWGACIHGHSHPAVMNAAIQKLKSGASFGMSTEAELQIAQKVSQLMPSVEKIRFVSSGTEATMSAIRLARGFTSRNIIIKFTGHYHGHADFLLVKAGSGVGSFITEASSKGILPDVVKTTICCPFNDVEATAKVIRDNAHDLAAVILEPIAGNMGVVEATQTFMNMLREETQKCGALLIFDEVMTGFRVAKGGAQALYSIKPDLTCLGKIVGGGFPAAAFGGRREIMDHLAPLGSVYQAGTLSGFPAAMEAGYQSLCLVEEENFYADLQRKTERLARPIQEAIIRNELNACVQYKSSMFTLFLGKRKVSSFEDGLGCDKDRFARFYLFMRQKGVNLPPLQLEAWFLSAAHTDEQIDYTSQTIVEFLED